MLRAVPAFPRVRLDSRQVCPQARPATAVQLRSPPLAHSPSPPTVEKEGEEEDGQELGGSGAIGPREQHRAHLWQERGAQQAQRAGAQRSWNPFCCNAGPPCERAARVAQSENQECASQKQSSALNSMTSVRKTAT